MNKFLNDLERKIGSYAIPRLTFILISCYIIGYMIEQVSPAALTYMTLDPSRILRGEVWRLVTWIMITPFGSSQEGFRVIFTIITMIFYLSIGTTLERAWGDFRYNVYIFSGLLFTVIAAFLSYFFLAAYYGSGDIQIGSAFSTYYIMVSIFLAYGATFPEAQVLLYFVIPVKIKYLAWIYAAYILYDCVTYIRLIVSGHPVYWVMIVSMLASLLNFVIFFITNPRNKRFSAAERRRRRAYDQQMRAARRQFDDNIRRTRQGNENRPASWNDDHKNVFTQDKADSSPFYDSGTSFRRQAGPSPVITPIKPTRHRCAICGRTEADDPDLEFRFCSRCAGDYEYCSDHLFTHEHIRSNSGQDAPLS